MLLVRNSRFEIRDSRFEILERATYPNKGTHEDLRRRRAHWGSFVARFQARSVTRAQSRRRGHNGRRTPPQPQRAAWHARSLEPILASAHDGRRSAGSANEASRANTPVVRARHSRPPSRPCLLIAPGILNLRVQYKRKARGCGRAPPSPPQAYSRRVFVCTRRVTPFNTTLLAVNSLHKPYAYLPNLLAPDRSRTLLKLQWSPP